MEQHVTDSPQVPSLSDPLTDALGSLRMSGLFYCPSELTSPWGVTLPHMPGNLWFHVVTSGSGTLVDRTGETYEFRSGDVVVLPHGGGHTAFDKPHVATPTVFDLPHEYFSEQYAIMRHGGGGELTTLTCGLVRFGNPAATHLLDLLPEVLFLRTSDDMQRWQSFSALLALMATETSSTQPGSEAVVTRLCDILIIQAIRQWIEMEGADQGGWIGALRDPLVGQAIVHIHRAPDRAWTVDGLASAVGASRSSFAARFTELVGVAPLAYVTSWRMHLARHQLVTTDLSINQIACDVGYGSEAAFSRAFKRETGASPSTVRKNAADLESRHEHADRP